MKTATLYHRWFLLASRLIVGVIFVAAGVLKLNSPLALADSIASFQLLPAKLINLLALALPPLEIVLGALLVIGWKLRPVSFGTLTLCAIFFVALSQALFRGIEVDCGCFGGGAPSVWKTWMSLGRDVLLGAGVYFVYRASHSETISFPLEEQRA
jgi:putative oxidoreductase